MKKLIPALCMLLVAACLMGTSTYAWFAANLEVTASGMQVKAMSDGGLALGIYSAYNTAPVDGAFKGKVDASEGWSNAAGAAEVKPTSFTGAISGTNYVAGNWVTSTSNDPGSAASNGTYATAIDNSTTWGATTGSDIFQHTKWQVKSLVEDKTYELKITGVVVTGGTTTAGAAKNLEKSLRVLVKYGDKYFKFAPNCTEAEAGAAKFYTGTTPATDANLIWGLKADGTTAAPIEVVIGNVSTTASDIEVFIYYEGEDANCMSANAINIKTLSVAITYATGSVVTP